MGSIIDLLCLPDHSILTRGTDLVSRVINGEVVEGLFLYQVVRANELILSLFILSRAKKIVREVRGGFTLEIERKIKDLSALQEISCECVKRTAVIAAE